jgi:hypothetical protein
MAPRRRGVPDAVRRWPVRRGGAAPGLGRPADPDRDRGAPVTRRQGTAPASVGRAGCGLVADRSALTSELPAFDPEALEPVTAAAPRAVLTRPAAHRGAVWSSVSISPPARFQDGIVDDRAVPAGQRRRLPASLGRLAVGFGRGRPHSPDEWAARGGPGRAGAPTSSSPPAVVAVRRHQAAGGSRTWRNAPVTASSPPATPQLTGKGRCGRGAGRAHPPSTAHRHHGSHPGPPGLRNWPVAGQREPPPAEPLRLYSGGSTTWSWSSRFPGPAAGGSAVHNGARLSTLPTPRTRTPQGAASCQAPSLAISPAGPRPTDATIAALRSARTTPAPVDSGGAWGRGPQATRRRERHPDTIVEVPRCRVHPGRSPGPAPRTSTPTRSPGSSTIGVPMTAIRILHDGWDLPRHQAAKPSAQPPPRCARPAAHQRRSWPADPARCSEPAHRPDIWAAAASPLSEGGHRTPPSSPT